MEKEPIPMSEPSNEADRPKNFAETQADFDQSRVEAEKLETENPN
ncbi:MAG: hypothetical protein WD157_02010 [Patescibacteria group bacterium]